MLKTYLTILFYCLSPSSIWGSEYTYRWVTYKGQRVKKWTISNERYMYKKGLTENSKAKRALPKKATRTISSLDSTIEPILKKQRLFLKFTFSAVSLNTLDIHSGANAIAVSDLSYGLNLKWTHLLSKKFEFFFDGALSRYRFSVSKNKTLNNSSFLKSYAGVGIRYKQNLNHSYNFEIGVGDSFFLLAKSQNELKIDKVPIPALNISGKHNLILFDSGYSLGVNWRLGVLTPTSLPNYSTKLGSYWNVGISSQLSKRVTIGINYGQRHVSTGDLKQTNKGISIAGGFGISF